MKHSTISSYPVSLLSQRSVQGAPLYVTVVRELLDIHLIVVNILLSLGNRSFAAASVFLAPTADPLLFLADGSLFGVDLGTDLTFFRQLIPVHDEFHATGLPGSVLFGAVLSEVSPFPALARHLVGIIKTHFGWSGCGWMVH